MNKLSLNAGKTELIFFHSKYSKNLNFENVYINFDGIRLLPVDYVKYLGMLIDNNLTWNYHINDLSKKLSQVNGILSKLRYNAPLEYAFKFILLYSIRN